VKPEGSLELDRPLLRKENVVDKEAVEWNPQEQKKRGRPKRSWQRTIREEASADGKTRREIK
jgi:predicted ArsR family transcriptional regulator